MSNFFLSVQGGLFLGVGLSAGAFCIWRIIQNIQWSSKQLRKRIDNLECDVYDIKKREKK